MSFGPGAETVAEAEAEAEAARMRTRPGSERCLSECSRVYKYEWAKWA